MAKYICDVCGYEYDPAAGDPENGIAPGTLCIKKTSVFAGACFFVTYSSVSSIESPTILR